MYNERSPGFRRAEHRAAGFAGEDIAMPMYDYKCAQCGHRFELLQSISFKGETVCPKCGGRVDRVYEGKWSVGKRASGGGGCSCGGNCQGCAGCGK